MKKLVIDLGHGGTDQGAIERGVEVWQYSNTNEKLNKFSNGLCTDVSKIFNVKNRVLKLSKELSVLRNTTMPAALIENI